MEQVLSWSPGTLQSVAGRLAAFSGQASQVGSLLDGAASANWDGQAASAAVSNANGLKTGVNELSTRLGNMSRGITSAATQIETAQEKIRSAKAAAASHSGFAINASGTVTMPQMPTDPLPTPAEEAQYNQTLATVQGLARRALEAVRDAEEADRALRDTLAQAMGGSPRQLVQAAVSFVGQLNVAMFNQMSNGMWNAADYMVATQVGFYVNVGDNAADWMTEHYAGVIGDAVANGQAWYGEHEGDVAGVLDFFNSASEASWNNMGGLYTNAAGFLGEGARDGVDYAQNWWDGVSETEFGQNVNEMFTGAGNDLENGYNWVTTTGMDNLQSWGPWFQEQGTNLWNGDAGHTVRDTYNDVYNSGVGHDARDAYHDVMNSETADQVRHSVDVAQENWNNAVNGPLGDQVRNAGDAIQNIYQDAAAGPIGDQVERAGEHLENVWDDISGAAVDGWNRAAGDD
jgi:uncharacterized protein YukE